MGNVGIVLVSHSRLLAEAVKGLVHALTSLDLPIAIAAGAGESRKELGTDAVEILEAVRSVMSDKGVIILTDMGSALLSTDMAISLLDEAEQANVKSCVGPFVEGAVAAGIMANLGESLDKVMEEAELALRQKQQHFSHLEKQDLSFEADDGIDFSGHTLRLTIQNIHGLHARPVAKLIQAIAKFDATISVANLTNHRGPVSVRSPSALASLEILKGHAIIFDVEGPDAEVALSAIQNLASNHFGESVSQEKTNEPMLNDQALTDNKRGFPVTAGVAIGPVLSLSTTTAAIPKHTITDIVLEKSKLQQAIEAARAKIIQEQKDAKKKIGLEAAEIFDAQLIALQDPDLIMHSRNYIQGEFSNAANAWYTSLLEVTARYKALSDPYLRQRAVDVTEAGERVLHELGISSEYAIIGNTPGILVVTDLHPGQAAKIQKDSVIGVICLEGSKTSHSSIILRSTGMPQVIQAAGVLGTINLKDPSLQLAFDGETGDIYINPSKSQLEVLQSKQKRLSEEKSAQTAAASSPAITKDGVAIKVTANATSTLDAKKSLSLGAEGIGLLRTEFLFLERQDAPDEEAQYVALRPIIEAMGNLPVIVRTLDAGGDKQLPYLHMPHEENPYLGVRALRISLQNPDLFETQLRAILRAGHGHNVQCMLPMVSELSELQTAKKILLSAHEALEKQKVPHAWPMPLGIMIEIPSAAILAGQLAAEADFFSIGTNDLTQYTLSADRGNAALAYYHDALHPAVLTLIKNVVTAASKHGKSVSVCGEAAGDIQSAKILIGLGITGLSVSPAALAEIKAEVRKSSFAELQAMAVRALQSSDAKTVRSLN